MTPKNGVSALSQTPDNSQLHVRQIGFGERFSQRCVALLTGNSIRVNELIHTYVGNNTYTSKKDLLSDISVFLRVAYPKLRLKLQDIPQDNRATHNPSRPFFQIPDTSFMIVSEQDLDERQQKYFKQLSNYQPFQSIIKDKLRIINSYHHKVSGLYNAEYFNEYVSKMPCALIAIDLNGMKDWNDTYGHSMGDLVLSLFGQAIQKALRDGDVGCHPHGDEFWIAAHNVSDPSQLNHIITRVRDELDKLCESNDIFHTTPIMFTWGYSLYDQEKDFEIRQEEADAHMYSNKSSEGRVSRPVKSIATFTPVQKTEFFQEVGSVITPEERTSALDVMLKCMQPAEREQFLRDQLARL